MLALTLAQIPYATRRSEIVALTGRNSRILNDVDEGIHIIMDRVTGRTNDAYIEFMTMNDAMKAVEKFNEQQAHGRHPRLGDRPIEVELSSQSVLMGALFPQARGIVWMGSEPVLQQPRVEEPWNRFKGFISAEEMTILVKHVESPHRVRLSLSLSLPSFLPPFSIPPLSMCVPADMPPPPQVALCARMPPAPL